MEDFIVESHLDVVVLYLGVLTWKYSLASMVVLNMSRHNEIRLVSFIVKAHRF